MLITSKDYLLRNIQNNVGANVWVLRPSQVDTTLPLTPCCVRQVSPCLLVTPPSSAIFPLQLAGLLRAGQPPSCTPEPVTEQVRNGRVQTPKGSSAYLCAHRLAPVHTDGPGPAALGSSVQLNRTKPQIAHPRPQLMHQPRSGQSPSLAVRAPVPAEPPHPHPRLQACLGSWPLGAHWRGSIYADFHCSMGVWLVSPVN